MKKSRVREREIKVEKRYRASYIRVFVLKQRCSTFLLIRLFILLTHFFSFLHYIIIIYIISPFYTIPSLLIPINYSSYSFFSLFIFPFLFVTYSPSFFDVFLCAFLCLFSISFFLSVHPF